MIAKAAAGSNRCSYLRLAIMCLLLGVIGCAGYQIGPSTLYRPDIRTVYVPIFESDSYRRNLGERLTEAVVKEIESRSTFKVVHSPDADSVLTGRIVTERKRVLSENRFDDARNVETDLVVRVAWHDRRGDPILQSQNFSIAQQQFLVGASADFVPEAGQSISTAHQEVIQRLARQIVSQMETPW